MFLANENFPRPSILLLRSNNYSTKSIQEEMPGVADETVLKIASANKLNILTFDKDYGELIFKYALLQPPAVIYFKEKGDTPLFAGTTLLHLLIRNEFSFANAFTVIEEKNVRQRFY